MTQTVETVLATIDYCCEVGDGGEPCYHCEQKLFLINAICAGLAFGGFFAGRQVRLQNFVDGVFGPNVAEIVYVPS